MNNISFSMEFYNALISQKVTLSMNQDITNSNLWVYDGSRSLGKYNLSFTLHPHCSNAPSTPSSTRRSEASIPYFVLSNNKSKIISF